ncbi:MarR family winged helix-turn-helix transcriptional regulator [Kribbella monticola]|uniref:MarR family winged helix-turn-helix transcriptional regulator n=1 Tax=Kribbella monticola TaxID=2185285 RepID=UPI001E4C8E87|nr:MarR family winged helix-turn-helix transcriptional regulator [Kribbella monticola]
MEEKTPSVLLTTPSWLLTQTAMHAQRIVAEAFAAENSRGYHFRLLATLMEFGPSSQAALGRHTGIDRSDIVATVNELVAAGYVERSPDPADGRRNIISLTTAGKRRHRHLSELVDTIQDKIFAPLSSTERATLAGLLTKVLAHHS